MAHPSLLYPSLYFPKKRALQCGFLVPFSTPTGLGADGQKVTAFLAFVVFAIVPELEPNVAVGARDFALAFSLGFPLAVTFASLRRVLLDKKDPLN